MRNLLIAGLFLLPFIAYANETPCIVQTDKGVELRNDIVSIVFSMSGEFLSCKELSSGVDYVRSGKPKIAKAITKTGKSINADNLSFNGNRLTVYFERYKIVLDVRTEGNYFTFEVVGGTLAELEKATFLDLKFNYDYTSPDSFVAAGVAMSLQTNPVLYPSGEDKQVIAECTAHTGMLGSKIAFVACKKSALRRTLKDIYASIPKGSVPISLTGGAYALDNSLNRNDCLLTKGFSPSEVQNYVDVFGRIGINQFDFEIGPHTFIQGDFTFPKFGSATSFRKQIVEPLLNSGIVSTLHTYSFYIGYDAIDILSNPKWQQQLEFVETYVLGKAMPLSATSVELRGVKPKFNNQIELLADCSPYLLIDNEIIRYSFESNGSITCKRGQCGTTPSAHKVGAKVMVIGGHYSHIAPKPGSELFYEIARRTAKAYNEGGFKGFYFDAFDGLKWHLKRAGLGDYLWYYGAAFINEVLKYCEGEPLVEYSTLYPSIWSARGRGGAWDTPNRGYKNFIDDHLKSNLILQNKFYTTTLGWLNFNPTHKDMPGNFATKYMFSDDVDYLGCKAIAYQQSVVYNNLSVVNINTSPALRRNLDIYTPYSKLKKEGYFSEKVLSTLRNSEYEYKLAKKNGKWGFYEMVYCRSKIRDIEQFRLVSYNPFKRQKPFIRIENMYASECRTNNLLIKFDENSDVRNQNCALSFSDPKDLSAYMAIKIRLKGNGEDSKDAICIRLQSGSSTSGYADYIVRTNFDGWKDIVLADLDNGEFSNLVFKGMEDDNYRTHRYNVSFSSIQSVNLFFAGECKGVKVKEVSAVPLTTNALTKPVVRIGNTAITFPDTIHSGEYLEYNVGEKYAYIFDRIGTVRSVRVSQKGRFRVPHGSFSVEVNGTPELNDVATQIVLTVGAQGRFVGN